VDAGHFQVEMDLVNGFLDEDRAGGGDQRTEIWAVAPMNLKLGPGTARTSGRARPWSMLGSRTALQAPSRRRQDSETCRRGSNTTSGATMAAPPPWP
jgi:hypothetical protein